MNFNKTILEAIKKRIAENNKLTINSIDCELSINDAERSFIEDNLQISLINHKHIHSLCMCFETNSIFFELDIKDIQFFLDNNKDYDVQHRVIKCYDLSFNIKIDDISDVQDYINNFFNKSIFDIFNNKNIKSNLIDITSDIIIF